MASKFLHVKNEAGKDPEILIYGPIGRSMWSDEGITGEDFTNAINKIPKGTKLTVGINSQGGSVGEGMAIYNAIERRAADVTARVDGYALSIASFLAQAASKVVSPKSSIWMIHRASMWSQGNAAALRKDAEMLDTHDDVICTAYCVRTSKDETEIKAAMDAETWMSGEEAIAYGLADEAGTSDAFDLAPIDASKFKNCPANFRKVIASAKAGRAVAALLSLVTNEGGQAGNKPAAASAEIAKPMQTDTTAAVATPPNATEIAELRQQLASEKKTRITAEVKRRGENKIPNDKIEFFVKNALADEEGTYGVIDAMPVAFEAGKPIRATVEIVSENPLEKIRAEHKTATARKSAMVLDWKELFDDACARDTRRGVLPLNSNTYSATLVTSFLQDGCITNLQNVWAALKAFSMDFSTDPYKPLATSVLKQATAGAATQTDATNFESGNSTVAPVSVVMHQYTQSFQVSNSDLNNGLRMENLVTINSANFANKVIEVATVPITVALFDGTTALGAPSLIRAAANFDFSDLATLQAALKKSPIKNLILDGSYIARIANTPGFFQAAGIVGGDTGSWKAFGWDNICPLSDWTGAGANVQGFACHPQAIGGITGLPLTPPNIPGGILSQSTFQVPGLGVTVALYSWFNPGTRTMWTSYDIMAGFKEVDTTAGFLVASA